MGPKVINVVSIIPVNVAESVATCQPWQKKWPRRRIKDTGVEAERENDLEVVKGRTDQSPVRGKRNAGEKDRDRDPEKEIGRRRKRDPGLDLLRGIATRRKGRRTKLKRKRKVNQRVKIELLKRMKLT